MPLIPAAKRAPNIRETINAIPEFSEGWTAECELRTIAYGFAHRIVKRSDAMGDKTGFVLLRRRWVVEPFHGSAATAASPRIRKTMTLHAFVLLASIQISIRRLSCARLYFFHSYDDEKRSDDQHGLAVLKLVFYSIRIEQFTSVNDASFSSLGN